LKERAAVSGAERRMPATLDAVKRETRGKNEARRLRAAGRIPAVVYGGADGAVAVDVDPKLLSRILHSDTGVNTLIGLNIDGGTATQVLVKEFLLDPVHHKLLHADFYRVSMDKPITVTVVVTLKGEARGVKQQGGIVDFPGREVEIEVLPAEIPESLEVDISELMIGQGVRLRDIATGARWTPVSDPDTMLVHVVAPRAEEPSPTEAAAAVPGAPAEPEVIKKGKTEKEEEK
jgi:large subunit ribosomal protein L25